jgi:hypothetical protein
MALRYEAGIDNLNSYYYGNTSDDGDLVVLDSPKNGEYYLFKTPNWGTSSVNRRDIKNWLTKKGFTEGFFFREQADKKQDTAVILKSTIDDEIVTKSQQLHISPMLMILNQAASRFWKNADPADKETHPKNAEVEEWLIKEGLPKTYAPQAATIIRPEWATKGRR